MKLFASFQVDLVGTLGNDADRLVKITGLDGNCFQIAGFNKR